MWRLLSLNYFFRQLSDLCQLCDAAEVFTTLVPHSMVMCADGVSAVRMAAIPGLSSILRKLKGTEWLQPFAEEIKKLGIQPSYSSRQLYPPPIFHRMISFSDKFCRPLVLALSRERFALSWNRRTLSPIFFRFWWPSRTTQSPTCVYQSQKPSANFQQVVRLICLFGVSNKSQFPEKKFFLDHFSVNELVISNLKQLQQDEDGDVRDKAA